MKNEKKLFGKTNAITLIALVVTIVVLLILAGVSISMLGGENGIITRANESSTETAHAQVKEQIRLKIAEYTATSKTLEFITYLQSEEGGNVLNLDGTVNLANISSNNIKTGKGSGIKDVYKIEKIEDNKYNLKYYDKKEVAVILDTMTLSGGKTLGEIYYGDASIEPTNPEYFTYTLDEETKTATLTGVKEEYGVWGYYSESAYVVAIKDGEKIITDVVIPCEIINNGIKYTVTSIIHGAFYVSGSSNKTSQFTSFAIPNTVTSIGDFAFQGCRGLTNIAIPNSVTNIGNSAFSGCSSLTSIVIPDRVTIIGSSAFSGCSSLTSIIIPNGITSIEDNAFFNCKSLISVTIPNTITKIGASAS